MIQAIYQWQVKPGCEEDFVQAWVRGTKAIRATVKGARGSVLLKNHRHPSVFMAIAQWDSFEDWWAFRQGDPPDPGAFQMAAAVSNLSSVEAFYGVCDLRVAQASEAKEWMQVRTPFIAEAVAA